MTRVRVSMVFATALLAAVAACSSPQQQAATPTPQATPDSIAQAERARQDSVARAEQAQQDSIRRAQEEAERIRRQQEEEDARRQMEGLRGTLAQVINFDFDRADIRPGDAAVLDAKIPLLQENPTVRVRISGHCDERGSDEYNLALGMRRAVAAKQYLVNHGIDAGRIDVVSYGEERPVDPGHEEGAWSRNRRSEFEITGGM